MSLQIDKICANLFKDKLMKPILYLPIILTLLFGRIQAQQGISLTTVDEVYTQSEVNYLGNKTLTLKLTSGLIIKVTPVNPPELDESFYKTILANGQLEYKNYEQSKNDYFIRKSKKKQKEEKSNTEMLLELAEILYERKTITEEQYSSAKKSIENRNSEASPEIDANIPIAMNPYYLNKKYLSVFEITLENPTTKPILFDEEINILLGSKLYSRYSTQEVLELYKVENINNFAKISLLTNENLPETILVPSGVIFSKYICTAPIEYETGPLTLIISSLTNSTRANWDVNISTNQIEKTYIYNVFDFKVTSNTGLAITDITSVDGVLLQSSDSVDFHLSNQKLYVNREDLDKPIIIIALLIYIDNAYFAVTTITPKEYIDIDKKRTLDIDIETRSIDIGRKIK